MGTSVRICQLRFALRASLLSPSTRCSPLQVWISFAVASESSAALRDSARLRTELAILAAKLAHRQADVDSLFRTNAELAHTNVELANQLDQWEQFTQSQGQATSQEVGAIEKEYEILAMMISY